MTDVIVRHPRICLAKAARLPQGTNVTDLTVHYIARLPQEYQSRWFSGIASALGARGLSFEPRPRHTKSIKNGTSGYLAWCSAL